MEGRKPIRVRRTNREFAKDGQSHFVIPDYDEDDSVSGTEEEKAVVQDAVSDLKDLTVEAAENSSKQEEEEKMPFEDLNLLTVVRLKAWCREAGLPVSGKKADLVERLNAYMVRSENKNNDVYIPGWDDWDKRQL